jgi:hypothetical protein
VLVAAFLLLPVTGRAEQFAWGQGKWLGVWKTVLTFGASFRAGTPQNQLVGAGARDEFPGATGAVGVNDDAQLNFPDYGELVSAPLTLTSELNLSHRSGQGVFVRARAWYDMRLESFDAPHGNSSNGYTANSRLVDTGNLGAGKFKGIDIYDLFYYGHFRAGQTRFLLRVGRQALDWGEGIFYTGINTINPYDYAWLTTSGARLANGGKLPVNRIYANVAAPAGLVVDGFLNLEFRESVMPACGTYFTALDPSMHPGCNLATVGGLSDLQSATFVKSRAYYNGILYPNGVFPDGGPDHPNATREPSRFSGWGLSARKFVEPLATELGFYYADYTNPLPVLSPIPGADALSFAVNTNFQPIQSFAVSASTGLREVSLNAQFTRHWDFPTARNAPAYIEGSTSGIGPYGYMMTDFAEREAPGFYPMNIAQLQYGGVWQFGRHVGLTDATLTGEALMSWNTNNPPTDGPNAERLQRTGNFGLANWSEEGYTCDPGPLPNGIINFCDIEGFQTPFAMGYKLRAQTVLPQFGPGISLTPWLHFTHDITGYSADYAITSGRITYGAGLRVDVRQSYFIELSALWFRRGTEFDPIRDRGHYTIAMGYNLQ